MIKKIFLLLAVVGRFIGYFVYSWLLKLEGKKYPIVKLSMVSAILLILALGFFRFYNDISPDTKYFPAKLKNGKIIPAENK